MAKGADAQPVVGRRAAQLLLAMGLAGTLIVGLLAPGSPAAATSTTAPQLGMVADISWGLSHADIDRTVKLMRDAGTRWARVNVSWSGGEPAGKGQYNTTWLAEIDYAVKAATAAGIQVLMPISDGVPFWASADPAKSSAGGNTWNKMWKPTSMDDYGDFVRYVVSRYRPLGVRTYEIWNEPNHAHFWPSGVDPAAYVPMLRAGYTAVKAVDPGATVLLGGLSKSDAPYLAGVYAAGGGAYFDVAAVHPYTGDAGPTACWNDSAGRPALDAFCALRNVREVMVANGDSAKTIWLTEFGWSTGTGAYGVDEDTQALYLRQAATELAERYPYVTHALWYMVRDLYWSTDLTSYIHNLGLVRRDFSPKPALAAFSEVAGGATSSPTTSTTSPTTTTAPTTTTTVAPVVQAPQRVRVAGDDRVLTAVALSQQMVERAGTVVIARADAYADALAAAPLAAKHDTSILLTTSRALPDAVAAEVRRLGASRAIVIGGPAAIAPEVEEGLRRAGALTVTRIAGVNRHDTARQIARSVGGTSAIIVEGSNPDPRRGWPDAVAAASLAAATGQPILLTETSTLPQETAAALRELGTTSVVVVGGTAAVSDSTLSAIAGGITVSRIAGKDRFETSVRVAERIRSAGGDGRTAWVATGLDWPDALAAGPLVAMRNSVLVLVDGHDASRSPASTTWLRDQQATLDEIVVVGGTGSVTGSVEDVLAGGAG